LLLQKGIDCTSQLKEIEKYQDMWKEAYFYPYKSVKKQIFNPNEKLAPTDTWSEYTARKYLAENTPVGSKAWTASLEQLKRWVDRYIPGGVRKILTVDEWSPRARTLSDV
jgi:hypothetical protein